MFCCILIAAGVILLVLYFVSRWFTPATIMLDRAHVMVTGGSSGIGKCIAIESMKQGANVTLLARNAVKLAEAADEVKQYKIYDDQKVLCKSVDLSKEYGAVEEAIHSAEEALGPVLMLVNSAGTSHSATFEETPLAQFRTLMEVNYVGSVYATRAVLPGMKRRQSGRLVYLSSQAGQIGIYGFTAYSASKFALRGLSEALQMEVKPYNIRVTVSYPPDTETPGFEDEQRNKPMETKLISETSGLFQAPHVAKRIINDALEGRFASYVGLDGYLLWSLTAGGAPVTNLMEAIQQVCTMGVFRVISLVLLRQFDGIINRCRTGRDQQRTKSD